MGVSFTEFVDKKMRESRKQLRIVRELLLKNGMKVLDFTESIDEDEPYIYLYNTNHGSSFGGLRIYKIGDSIAFRIQRQEKTHPYGTAYSLKITEMFNDIITDENNEEEAGKQVIEGVVKELQRFFARSAKAEKDLQSNDIAGSGGFLGRIQVQSSGLDYSSTVSNSL